MTLPASGAIDLYQIADEFSLAHSIPFPSGFYGLGGAPSSGPLSFADFYGRSSNSLSANKLFIGATGYGKSDTSTITSSVATTFTFSGAGLRVDTSQTDGYHAIVTVSTPLTGNGSVSGTVRVTATSGAYIDIDYDASWGPL